MYGEKFHSNKPHTEDAALTLKCFKVFCPFMTVYANKNICNSFSVKFSLTALLDILAKLPSGNYLLSDLARFIIESSQNQ